MERMPVDYQPGDLLFFAGKDWLSRAIALKTAGLKNLLNGRWWSHVGICCDHSWNNEPDFRRTILVESTTLNTRPCYLRGIVTIGVQAHLPMVRVADYPGAVWRLRLCRPLDSIERQRLSAFCLQTIGQPYNYRRAGELALAGWMLLRRLTEGQDPDADSWFCSDHVLTALKACDRVGQDHDAEDFSPGSLGRLVLHSGAVWPISQIASRSFMIK